MLLAADHSAQSTTFYVYRQSQQLSNNCIGNHVITYRLVVIGTGSWQVEEIRMFETGKWNDYDLKYSNNIIT